MASSGRASKSEAHFVQSTGRDEVPVAEVLSHHLGIEAEDVLLDLGRNAVQGGD